MAFNRPQLTALVKTLRDDMLSRVGDETQLRRADAEVYARVFAGAMHGLYGYTDWISKQIIWDRCDDDTLERWASMWLQVPRKPAAAATGVATFVLAVGAAVPAGSVVQAFDGVQYQTTADNIGSTAPVVALVAGAAGNRAAGQALSLVSPIAGVQTQAIASEISGGSDIESPDSLRARLIARVRTPPDGGSATDYLQWALEVPGVTRAWVAPLEQGAGTVVVRFVRDNDATPIPDAVEVAAVQAHIDPLRPVTADVYVVAPIADPLNFQITLTPPTVAVKAAVELELRDLLFREAAPGVTLLVSHIREAISTAAGETDHVLVSPAANVVPAIGHMPVFGSITWV
ncbi:baseplate J/gp47 family protein [Variovorax sp. RCC_210]|uniref:baseplate J/gp47 family protein n=1 Tax=Variovorax sp. RCC_210 TaxID=3239217 RepID=UPI003524541D